MEKMIKPKSRVASKASGNGTPISQETLRFFVNTMLGNGGKVDTYMEDMIDLFSEIDDADVEKLSTECPQMYDAIATGWTLLNQQMELDEQIDDEYVEKGTIDRDTILDSLKERFKQLRWFQDKEIPVDVLKSISNDMFIVFTVYIRLLDVYRIILRATAIISKVQADTGCPVPNKEYFDKINNYLPNVRSFIYPIFEGILNLK